jgi:tetratricopeptide (TPR) repeat protein
MGKHFDRAEVLFGQGRYELAEKELRAEIAENPKSADAHALLSMCLGNQKKQSNNLINSIQSIAQQRKKSNEELESIEYALSLEPNNDWYHCVLAMYWYRRVNFDRAKKQIEVAISLNPNSPNYFFVLACILFDSGNLKYNGMSATSRGFTELFKSYLIRYYLKPVFIPLKRSLTLDPNYISSLNLLTEVLVITGKYEQALEGSQTALFLAPNNAKSQDLHGKILSECGKYGEAIEYFQAALKIDPNYTQAKNNLLEAMRSHYYWIYPWISINSSRGKWVFVSLIPSMVILLPLIRYIITGSVNIKTPWENLGFVMLFFVMVISFTAQWIFNYFLIKEKKAIFLLTDRDAIISNYALSGAIAILLWMYTCLLPMDSEFRSLAMNIVGITGGILVPPFTFSAVKEIKSHILPVAYQCVVVTFGLINLILYFQDRETIFVLELFMLSVIATPIPAVYNCTTTN